MSPLDSEVFYVTEYKYHTSNDLHEIVTYKESRSGEKIENSTTHQSVSHKQTENGLLRTFLYKGDSKIRHTVLYDDSGKPKESTDYLYKDGKLNKKEVSYYTYNAESGEPEKTTSGDITHSYEYLFDKQGNKIEMRYKRNDKGGEDIFLYEFYQFDKHGNWLCEDEYTDTVLNDDLAYYKTNVRSIKYY